MELTKEMLAILKAAIAWDEARRDEGRDMPLPFRKFANGGCDANPVGSATFDVMRALDRLPIDQRVAIAGNRTQLAAAR